MRSLLIILIVFGSLPLVLIKPHVGILLWTWISLMNPHRMSWGLVEYIPLAVVIGGATLIGLVVSRETKRFPVSTVSVLLIAYTLWLCFTTIFALNPAGASDSLTRALKILLMTFVTMILINSRERIHALVWVTALSVGFYGFRGGVFTVLTGGNYRVWGPPASFLEDNNSLALAMAMVLSLLRYLQIHTTQRVVRWGLIFVMVCTLIAILGTYSRGGFLGLGATVAALIWKSRHKTVAMAIIAPIFAAALLLAPQKWWDRMQTIETFEEDPSARARLNSWAFGLKVAQDRPIIGGGFGVYWSKEIWAKYRPDLPVDSLGRAAHSIYFDTLGEHGYVGLVLFVMIGLAGIRTGTWIIKRTRDRPDLVWAHDLAGMLQVSLVAYATAGAFLSLALFDLYYLCLALLVVTRAVVARSLESESEQNPTELSPKPVRLRHLQAK